MMNTFKQLNTLAFVFVFLALATHSFGYQMENRIAKARIDSKTTFKTVESPVIGKIFYFQIVRTPFYHNCRMSDRTLWWPGTSRRLTSAD